MNKLWKYLMGHSAAELLIARAIIEFETGNEAKGVKDLLDGIMQLAPDSAKATIRTLLAKLSLVGILPEGP